MRTDSAADARIPKLVLLYRRLSASRRARSAGLVIALLVFAGGLVFAWRAADLQRLAAGPVVIIILMAPVSVAAAAWQLRALARALGVDPSWTQALRTTSLGTLSGLLPVSSGTMVRGGALIIWGGTVAGATRAMLFDAFLWLSLALAASGSAALALGHSLVGWALILGGLAAIGPSLLAAGATVSNRIRAEVAMARVLSLVAEIVRLGAAFAALGITIHGLEAMILVAPGAVAGILFILPGGLGVQEGLTAMLAELVGLGAATAFLAAALNRVVVLTTILVGEGILWLISNLQG
jgi:hypothetical protein